MAAPSLHRQAIIQAAIRLFRQQGYAATGLNEILARSGAPKGSLYHYFPGGKAQLGEAAVKAAAKAVRRTLEGLSAQSSSAAETLRRYIDQVAYWMAQSNWRDGCPITTTLLETAGELPDIAAAGQAAYANWAEVFGEALVRDGFPADRAAHLSRFALSALRGAVIQAKVERKPDALIETRDELIALLTPPGTTP